MVVLVNTVLNSWQIYVLNDYQRKSIVTGAQEEVCASMKKSQLLRVPHPDDRAIS